MGKRVRGAALRAKQRARKAVEELQEQQADTVATDRVVRQSDDALFVLDTTGDKVAPSQRPSKKQTQQKSKKQKQSLSEKDLQVVNKLMEKHSPAKLKAMAEKGRARMPDQFTRPRGLTTSRKAKPSFDLWNSEGDTKDTSDTNKKDKKSKAPAVGSGLAGTSPAPVTVKAQRAPQQPKPSVAVEVAKSGQSYQPDPVAHEQVLKAAVQVEVRRNRAEQYAEAPISQGLSKETRALLVEDSSDSNSDDNDERPESERNDKESTTSVNPAVPLVPNRSNKLTRAQRNKQKRLRQEQAVVDKRKQSKKLLKQVGELPRFAKELKAADKNRTERKMDVTDKSESQEPSGINVEEKLSRANPRNAPTVPVALSSELEASSSLRTIKPKGSLIQDRMNSFQDRNMAPKRRLRSSSQKRQGKRRKLKVKNRKDNEGADFVLMG